MTFVIDASAAVEVLFRTQLGDVTLRMLGDDTVVAPELVDAEVLAFIRRKTLQGIVSSRRAREAIATMAEWPIIRLPHAPLLMGAFAVHKNVSAYDAVYVAAAVVVDGEIVTADGPLARAPLGVVVRNVRA